MAQIQAKLAATQENIVEGEVRLQQAWESLTHSVRPEVQVERVVGSNPRRFWLGAFAAGLALGWLHGSERRLP